jgi:HAD superfamily hydrolase (TIGR01509 family)
VIKSVVFDCFGVLVPDKLTLLFSEYNLSIEQKLPISDAVKAYDLGHSDFDVVIEAVVAATALNQVQAEEWFDDRLLRFDEKLLKTIHELKTRGLHTGVLSNTGVAAFNRLFPVDLQSKTFSTVLLSGDVGLVKPDPAIFELFLRRSEISAQETLFIDDRQHNVDIAQRLGIQAYLYTTYESFMTDIQSLFTQ